MKGLLAVGALALMLIGCAKPISKEKSDHVGEWNGTAMSLLITQDCSVAYKRLKGGATTLIEAPLEEFQGDSVVVGVELTRR